MRRGVVDVLEDGLTVLVFELLDELLLRWSCRGRLWWCTLWFDVFGCAVVVSFVVARRLLVVKSMSCVRLMRGKSLWSGWNQKPETLNSKRQSTGSAEGKVQNELVGLPVREIRPWEQPDRTPVPPTRFPGWMA